MIICDSITATEIPKVIASNYGIHIPKDSEQVKHFSHLYHKPAKKAITDQLLSWKKVENQKWYYILFGMHTRLSEKVQFMSSRILLKELMKNNVFELWFS